MIFIFARIIVNIWLEQSLPLKRFKIPGQTLTLHTLHKTIFQTLCTLPVEDNGLLFVSGTVHAELIREETEYGGMRVSLEARLGRAKISLQIDIGFGDAVIPKALIKRFSVILDFPAPQLTMYSRETAIAEKYKTMVRLGAITSRRATSCCAAQPLTIRRMRQRITAASARTHPNPGIHACKWRSARVPRSVWPEHLSRTRRRDWLQAIGAW